MQKKSIDEKVKMVGKWFIKKFASQEDYEKGNAYHEGKVGENLLLNEGINEMWTLMCSGSGIKFDNTNARLGVGDSNVAADPIQTGLQAAVNKFWKGQDGGFPTYGTSQKATWRSTFQGNEANFSWQEFTCVNTADDTGKNMNRLVSNQGSKTSGQVWELTLEITLS